ncbi:MAG: L-threonylcarbamoyladenylate synthase [Proteobacteria bacterium]|nr:L-threonylcarbamoyladenylate synthase [Pseudomonadota bacterium]
MQSTANAENGPNAGADPLADAVAELRAGGLVAYPTETVWGLAAVADSAAAVARLRAWKGRAEDQPLPVLLAGPDSLTSCGVRVSPAARTLMAAFWPGPLTLVLPASGRFAPGVARADGAVGLRCSSHPLAAALATAVEASGLGPVTATSFNRSGDSPARRRSDALRLVGTSGSGPRVVPCEVDARGEAPSTVVDLTGARPRILRAGAVTADAIEAALA